MEHDDRAVDADLTRREVIKLGAAAVLTASIGAGESLAHSVAPGPPSQEAAPGFFTRDELALVDELSEMIVPADDHAPGARAANVAAYIDARLAETWDAKDKVVWRDGLALVDRLSRDAHGRSFLESAPGERLAILTRMARNEATPRAPEELFFAELKAKVVHAYYTSRIGIRDEMEYKGNSYLMQFVGFDAT